jgi:hypothetical protein
MMRALFTISLLELFIGGGGRLTAVGPISLRMILFACCLCATVIAILFPRRRSDGVLFAMLLVLLYLLVHVAGLVVGSINGGDTKQIFAEFQQALYWLAAPFYALMIQSEQDAQRAARLVQIAGLTLAVGYVAVLAALISGVISVHLLAATLGSSGEVTFRSGEFFFFKGFLYLCLSIVFFVALRSKYWTLLAAFAAIATVLTFTRGFLLSTPITVILLLWSQRRWGLAIPVLLLAAAAAFLIWVYFPSLDTSVSGAHEASTNQRLEDMMYMLDHVTAKTFLIGEGYGSMINNRFGIENTFLWALWKLGTLGLLFWLLPLALCVYYYSKISNRRSNPLANAFLFGTVLVYVQTATNPYLNNPIGLSFVLVALFSLRILYRHDGQRVACNGPLDPAEHMQSNE